ncbi:MAG: P1 family peptidase, partial [Dialister sp.]|nr:P1 family peptidase [Dialister sp.]MDY6115373.1 P1 family peptidase [Dialister sp.]
SGMAHDGFARSIRPVHTTMDGDTVFTMASGEIVAPVDTVGYLAEEAIRLAVLDAVKSAESMGARLAYADITSGEQLG